MMPILSICELKYCFSFLLCNFIISVEKSTHNDLYHIKLYSHTDHNSHNVTKNAFESIFQSTSQEFFLLQDINIIVDKICQVLKLIYKFDKLKIFI